ncbi:MAG: hypothetical protein AAGA62_16795, partial [Bacteroidota bacterium]
MITIFSKGSLLLFLTFSFGTTIFGQATDKRPVFNELCGAEGWKLAFKDSGTRKWQQRWSLDGLRATVVNTPRGMVFSAGPHERDDACHGVLWTKQSFSGDLKVSYTYTRTDTREKWVNILYLFATGAGERPKDIMAWREDRIIPSMRTYFNQMNAVHISYAAISRDSTGELGDYIRARIYPVPEGKRFKSTAIAPDYFNSELFEPGVPYRITTIK